MVFVPWLQVLTRYDRETDSLHDFILFICFIVLVPTIKCVTIT